MIQKWWLVIVLVVGVALGCSVQRSLAKISSETEAIMTIRDQHRANHFGKDAESFVATFADDLISVNRGGIAQDGHAENIQRFQTYFDAVEFRKWDDVSEPIIRFSDDLSMAYAITEKQVDLTYPGSEGETYLDQTRYAWMSIFRKVDGTWKVEAIASTNKEPENSVVDE